MKIIDIAEFYSERGGGVRTYIHQKLEASARQGHETIIVAPGPEDREQRVAGGKILWVKAPVLPLDHRYHMFVKRDRVYEILNRENPDVVEGSSPWRGGWLAAEWKGPAVKILFMHADPVASYPHLLLRPFLPTPRIDRLFSWFWRYLGRLSNNFDATLVSGQWLAARFRTFGLKNVHAIPFGVNRRLFNQALRNDAVRREMLKACGLEEDAAILVCVGRHHPEKHVGTLIDAVTRVNRKQKVGLFIIGDGLTRRWVEWKARRARHIHVAGQIDDRARVATLMASADALLHGCASETFGLAVAEALCAGTPVIVPNAGGAHDLAQPAFAEIYAVADSVSAADAITRLLARPRHQLSQAAITAAEAHIQTVNSHFDRLFVFYQQMIDQRKATGFKSAS